MPTATDVREETSGYHRRKRYRVLVHGLTHFCSMLPELLENDQWEIRDRSSNTPWQLANLFRDFWQCDLVFTWAGRIDMGRFLRGAWLSGAEKLVIFWCGSDVLRAQRMRAAGARIDPWIAERVHWAASPSLA